EHIRIDGLVEAHAYSLLHAVEVEGHRLVFLRNPWGNDKRWNGRWSDGDDAWAKKPSLQQRLRPRFQSDGAFWMAWVDFQASFDFVFVCAKPMRSGKAAEEHAHMSATGQVPSAPAQPPPQRRRLAVALPELLPKLKPGTRVEVMDVTRPEINGSIFEVVRWDEDAEEYELQGAPAAYWTCSRCGEVNKRLRDGCNVCSGAREVSAALLGRLRLRADSVILPAGTEV
ncbi:unnamed protein product, partial [Polarella glacialis]